MNRGADRLPRAARPQPHVPGFRASQPIATS